MPLIILSKNFIFYVHTVKVILVTYQIIKNAMTLCMFFGIAAKAMIPAIFTRRKNVTS